MCMRAVFVHVSSQYLLLSLPKSAAVGSKGAVLRAPLAGFALLSYPLLQASLSAGCAAVCSPQPAVLTTCCDTACMADIKQSLPPCHSPHLVHAAQHLCASANDCAHCRCCALLACSPRRRRLSRRPVPRHPPTLVRGSLPLWGMQEAGGALRQAVPGRLYSLPCHSMFCTCAVGDQVLLESTHTPHQ